MKLTIDNFLNIVKRNKANHQRGFFNTIPFYNASRLNYFVPGIIQGVMYLISARLGVGKSKFIRGFIMRSILDFMEKNPKVPVKLYFYSLEENENKFMAAMISQRMAERFPGTHLNFKTLMSYGMHSISDTDLRIIEDDLKHYQKILDKIEFRTETDIDNIYQYLLDEALQDGYLDENDIYHPNNPDTFRIVMIDHLFFLTGRSDTKETLNTFSLEMAVPLKKKFNYTFLLIQQQNLSKKMGKSAYDMEPRIEDLGEHKLTSQEADITMFLFNPTMYEWINNYMGYLIKLFNGNFRGLIIEKNRLDKTIIRIPFYMNAGTELFHEIPPSESIFEMIAFQKKHNLQIIDEQEMNNYYEPKEKEEDKEIYLALTPEEESYPEPDIDNEPIF